MVKYLNNKAQVSIFGLLIFVFELIIFVMFLPILINLITLAETTPGVSAFTLLLMKTTPVMMLFAILLSLLVFVGGRT